MTEPRTPVQRVLLAAAQASAGQRKPSHGDAALAADIIGTLADNPDLFAMLESQVTLGIHAGRFLKLLAEVADADITRWVY